MSDPVHGNEIGVGARVMAENGGWSWRDPSRGEHFRRCNYCGSMHPDDLAAEPAGTRIEWADRKYGWPHKFYVHVANRNPDTLFCRSKAPIGASDNTRGKIEGWLGFDELTDEQKQIIQRDGMARDPFTDRDQQSAYLFSPRAEHFGKFYTVHLADPEISTETKDTIAGRSGLRFRFENGRIGWGPA